MIKQITAKVLLSRVKGPDPWFGFYYNMNLYRGCEHRCIYCDSRSECYRIENFHDLLVKVNAIDLLKKEPFGVQVFAFSVFQAVPLCSWGRILICDLYSSIRF